METAKSKIVKMCVGASLLGAVAALIPGVANAANIGFSLTENEATNTLTSNLAGVAITTLGQDHWSIDLGGAGVTVASGAEGANMSWKEGTGDPGVNWLHYISGNTLELNSDWTGSMPGLSSLCGSTVPALNQGTTCVVGNNGSGDTYFVTVQDPNPTPTPEPASLALLGIGLAGVGYSRRKKA